MAWGRTNCRCLVSDRSCGRFYGPTGHPKLKGFNMFWWFQTKNNGGCAPAPNRRLKKNKPIFISTSCHHQFAFSHCIPLAQALMAALQQPSSASRPASLAFHELRTGKNKGYLSTWGIVQLSLMYDSWFTKCEFKCKMIQTLWTLTHIWLTVENKCTRLEEPLATWNCCSNFSLGCHKLASMHVSAAWMANGQRNG